MQIKRCCYQHKKEVGMDTASILREFEARPETNLSTHELDIGRRALEKALDALQRFEKMYPKIENAERRKQFEYIAQSVCEMAELFGLDVCAKVDPQFNGHLTISGDSILLRREYSPDFLPLMKKLMDICDEFYAAPSEKDGEMTICMSFVVPLYTREK